ncbi:MAG TPA: CBS domain-containing protein [Planosporangium sp.]|nr:CBS domain-containing protein [Planosporangium sp.]
MKIGDLAARNIVSVSPADSLRKAARAMVDAGVGSAIVLEDGGLAGIVTERDVLRAVAETSDPDDTPAGAVMTRDVVTAEPDWEVYEAAAEMAARRIRHLVITDGEQVVGVVSVRDVLLAGQRVPLANGEWAVLRDPLTFTVRERRKLQRYLLGVRGTDAEEGLPDLLGLLVGSWSLRLGLPPDATALRSLSPEDLAALREAVLAELPELQRAVHPSPGWRRR